MPACVTTIKLGLVAALVVGAVSLAASSPSDAGAPKPPRSQPSSPPTAPAPPVTISPETPGARPPLPPGVDHDRPLPVAAGR